MTTINLKNALQQHLQSLQWSAMSELSQEGELDFDFADLEQQAPNGPSAKLSAEQPSSSPSQPQTGDAIVQSSLSPAAAIGDTKPRSPDSPPIAANNAAHRPVLRSGDYGDPIVEAGDRRRALATIASEVAGCQRCPELCSNRTQTVFGAGPADAKIVFLGEGPGANEDQCGEPFVGAAGQLLNKILTASKLQRDQIYILNVVKCRPLGNRTPAGEEIENCWGYLERQLDIIQPTHIVCLGSVAAKSLLDTKSSLGKLRKQFHQYRGSKVVATYHPAYLLRTPDAKKFVWEDMKMLMNDLGVQL